jgi:hypothetical protein
MHAGVVLQDIIVELGRFAVALNSVVKLHEKIEPVGSVLTKDFNSWLPCVAAPKVKLPSGRTN